MNPIEGDFTGIQVEFGDNESFEGLLENDQVTLRYKRGDKMVDRFAIPLSAVPVLVQMITDLLA